MDEVPPSAKFTDPREMKTENLPRLTFLQPSLPHIALCFAFAGRAFVFISLTSICLAFLFSVLSFFVVFTSTTDTLAGLQNAKNVDCPRKDDESGREESHGRDLHTHPPVDVRAALTIGWYSTVQPYSHKWTKAGKVPRRFSVT